MSPTNHSNSVMDLLCITELETASIFLRSTNSLSSTSTKKVFVCYLTLAAEINFFFFVDIKLEPAACWFCWSRETTRSAIKSRLPAYLIFPNNPVGFVWNLSWLSGKPSGSTLLSAKNKLPHQHNAQTLKQTVIS